TGEQTLVQEYFSMDTRDFNNLTPEMHILFLETMLTPIVKIPVNHSDRLYKVFMQNPSSIVRYINVNVLLKSFETNQLIFRHLYDRITYDVLSIDPKNLIFELVSLLIEIGQNQISIISNNQTRRDRFPYRSVEEGIQSYPAFSVLDDLLRYEQSLSSSFVSDAVEYFNNKFSQDQI
ncbi:MAG: hypothetical protein AAFN11_08590, partial [Chloroflexota bacterium]